MALAAVRGLREFRDPVSAEELEQFETDVLAGFVLARASAGLADGTIRGDVGHLDQMRAWFGRPLWDMEPADADGYFGKVLRGSPSGTRLARARLRHRREDRHPLRGLSTRASGRICRAGIAVKPARPA
ncbi:hypothetical protein ACWGQ5_43705 [Streptomyces sp. NPDC055722]